MKNVNFFGNASDVKPFAKKNTLGINDEAKFLSLMQSHVSYQDLNQITQNQSQTSFATKDFSMLSQGQKMNFY